MRKRSPEEIHQRSRWIHQRLAHRRFPVTLVLDNIRSLHNVGAIFRTADAVRLERLILTGITGRPPRREIDKTALGAVEAVPWTYQQDVVGALQQLKQQGHTIYLLEQTTRSHPHFDVSYRFPATLVVGNEVFGISDEVLPLADEAVEIPMFGEKHSLNVAVACGVILYKMLEVFLQKDQSWQILLRDLQQLERPAW